MSDAQMKDAYERVLKRTLNISNILFLRNINSV